MLWRRRLAAAAISVAVDVWRCCLCCMAAAEKLNYSFRWPISFLLAYLTIRYRNLLYRLCYGVDCDRRRCTFSFTLIRCAATERIIALLHHVIPSLRGNIRRTMLRLQLTLCVFLMG